MAQHHVVGYAFVVMSLFCIIVLHVAAWRFKAAIHGKERYKALFYGFYALASLFLAIVTAIIARSLMAEFAWAILAGAALLIPLALVAAWESPVHGRQGTAAQS